jgi:hypothetical protein
MDGTGGHYVKENKSETNAACSHLYMEVKS